MPSAETNSVVRISAPFSRQIRRKTELVTPAIGARKRGKGPPFMALMGGAQMSSAGAAETGAGEGSESPDSKAETSS